MVDVYFTLSTGRCGTKFLSRLCRDNLEDTVCRHEPYFDRGNPPMFGLSIYDFSIGRHDRIQNDVRAKRDWIERCGAKVYIETSHAFLKSFYQASLDFWPDIRFIHVIRNPMSTARSEANRQIAAERWHLPFRNYWAEDGKSRFAWSLSGLEEIFRSYDLSKLSLFQRYVVEWVEIQNRAMWVIEAAKAHDRCFTLHSPVDLNKPERIQALFDHFGMKTRKAQVIFPTNYSKRLSQNRNLRYKTQVSDQDAKEFKDVIDKMPTRYLEIFRREPYASFPWVEMVQR
ncbi:MAG: hypothetical protein JNL61_17960 [Rhizobiaceae bacterium]|nr:hypothetical protein [Rhizobiaceae bacterium]